jgi:hypothetical protein
VAISRTAAREGRATHMMNPKDRRNAEVKTRGGIRGRGAVFVP